MQVTCTDCGTEYDDVDRWTYCPHEGFEMRTAFTRRDGTTVVCTSIEQLQRELEH